MPSMGTVLERRTGVKAIWHDHRDTWSDATGQRAQRERRRSYLWFFGVPTVLAAPLVIFRIDLSGVGQILAGTSVFTGLLFGLLGVIFNMGVTLRKEGDKFPNAYSLPTVISDLRANITYAIAVALVLNVVLVVGAALGHPNAGLTWQWAPPLVWLFTHLGLTLLVVLRRFRTAFNYITR